MRLNYVIRFFILMYLAGTNTLVAQQTWSLNQCISFAIENNVDLSQYNIQEKISGESFNQSKRNLLPGVSPFFECRTEFWAFCRPKHERYYQHRIF